jgi:hypothetical protein
VAKFGVSFWSSEFEIRRGVYPRRFLKCVQVLEDQWVADEREMSVWKLKIWRALVRGVVRRGWASCRRITWS